MLIFPKNNKTKYTKETKMFCWFLGPTNIDLGPIRILIQNKKLGLHSSLKDIWKIVFKMILDFREMNLTRIDLTPMYLTMENQGSRSSLKFYIFWSFLITWKYVSYDENDWIDQKLKEKIIFNIFEDECHTMQMIEQTQKYFWKYFLFFSIFYNF